MLEIKYNNPANFESEYRTFPSSNAEEKIFKAHLYLVRFYAKKYSKNNSINCTFDDAFQIGSLGLLSACHYYIPGGPAKFTTYASKCIENSIIRSISKRKTKTKRISIEDELERMQYLMQYLKSNIKMEFVGYRRPRVRRMRINNGFIDYNLGLYIEKHNHLMKLIGNNHLIFKRTKRKGEIIA